MAELQAAVGPTVAQELCDEICAQAGSGRGQSARAEKDFLKNRTGWDRQKSFDLGTKTPTGRVSKCRPDLVSTSLTKIVELKLMPNEAFTTNQDTFRDELKKGKHPPYASTDFLAVTPETCGC
jgi:hypothetical protein